MTSDVVRRALELARQKQAEARLKANGNGAGNGTGGALKSAAAKDAAEKAPEVAKPPEKKAESKPPEKKLDSEPSEPLVDESPAGDEEEVVPPAKGKRADDDALADAGLDPKATRALGKLPLPGVDDSATDEDESADEEESDGEDELVELPGVDDSATDEDESADDAFDELEGLLDEAEEEAAAEAAGEEEVEEPPAEEKEPPAKPHARDPTQVYSLEEDGAEEITDEEEEGRAPKPSQPPPPVPTTTRPSGPSTTKPAIPKKASEKNKAKAGARTLDEALEDGSTDRRFDVPKEAKGEDATFTLENGAKLTYLRETDDGVKFYRVYDGTGHYKKVKLPLGRSKIVHYGEGENRRKLTLTNSDNHTKVYDLPYPKASNGVIATAAYYGTELLNGAISVSTGGVSAIEWLANGATATSVVLTTISVVSGALGIRNAVAKSRAKKEALKELEAGSTE